MNEPRIVDDQPSFIVLEKPAGWLTHPNDRVRHPNVTQWLVERFPALSTVGDDPTRPGVVQRLDRDASGLIVIAKTPEAFEHLKSQFQSHTIQKEYTILVHGVIKNDGGTIAFPLARSRRTGRMAALPPSQSGKEARTHFSVNARTHRFTLLAVRTDTGRTHQIRTHFFAYGYPLVGDSIYQSKRWKDDAPRLFLHASRLGFAHPITNEWKEYTAPLPGELFRYLQQKKMVTEHGTTNVLQPTS